MRLPKIIYLQLAMITILSPVEIYSERTKTSSNGGRNRQVQISEEEKSIRLKKQPVMETQTVSDDDDERKTLAQQVLDGKYGLIQTELFSSPVERPGILSYEINPEVPKDNINNLGGLKPEEIWLAENHLLVLKGGSFSDTEQGGKVIWPPIDSYVAPQRQVKIPQNPKIPPPFPIQLKDGGPIEIIKGKNGTKAFPPYFGPPFLFQNPTNIPNEAKEIETKQKQGNLTQGNGGIPFPFLPPGIEFFPPAIAYLPPPGNLTELDEDDPSIYYPPSYDFVYTKNYTSYVPPGPLVPGIILPPPPNFFAPLEEKTRSHIPNSTNKLANLMKKPNKSRLSSNYRPRNKLPSQINSFKPKGLHISQEHKIIPVIQETLNKNQNKITLRPPRLNRTNEEWVPIPAPRPFYITDVNKLKIFSEDFNDHLFKYDIPQNGWVYENTTKEKFPIDNTRYKNIRGDDNKGLYITTEISDARFNTGSSPKTPTTNFQIYDTTFNNAAKELITADKIKTNIKVLKSSLVENTTPSRPFKQYYYNKPYFESNTLLPQVIYQDGTVTTQPGNGRIMVPNIKFEEDSRNIVKHKSKSSSFLYYEQEPKFQSDDGGYLYEAPQDSGINSYRSEQFRIISPNPTNKNKITAYSTTRKTPIYEYSYSAPGYGTIEAPKVGNNFETTPKPIMPESNLKSIKQQQYSYYGYQSTPKQNDFNFPKSNLDWIYSTVQPPVRKKNKYVNVNAYHTEQPYTSTYAPDTGLIDENTKKYFTLFGQKINQQDKEITTSLPQNFYSKPRYQNYDNVTPLPTKTTNKNIRFPGIYDIQRDRPYYTEEEYTTPKYRNSNKNTKSHAPKDNYSYFYSPTNIAFPAYREYEQQGFVRPDHPLNSDIDVNYKNREYEHKFVGINHPLDSDIDVNYKNREYEHKFVGLNHPLDTDINVNYKITNPTLNPDAEFIDPVYINPVSFKGNSYVSYRLPGNSGHFYFLTPQTIQQQNYQVRNTRVRYPEDEKSQLERRFKIPN